MIKVKQRDITDCGAACLASVAGHYNLQIPVAKIRQLASTDKRGTNILGMVEAATQLGFEAKGVKGPIGSLSQIPLPAIAHIVVNNLQHFVVIYKVSKEQILVMDPALGLLEKIPFEVFKVQWSGVLVLLLPADGFKETNENVSNSKRFWYLLSPHRSVMFQALFGAVIYTVLGLATSIYVQQIIDKVVPDANASLLNMLSVAMLLIITMQLVIGYTKSVFSLKTGQQIDARLILGYYKHLLKLPQRFFDTMRVGEILSRVNDAVKIRAFINEVALNMVVNSLIVVFSFFLMFLYYWKLAIISLCLIPIYGLIYWVSNQLNKKYQRRIMEDSAALETQLVESLNGVSTIKRFGLEDYSNIQTEVRFVSLLKTVFLTGMQGTQISSLTDFISKAFVILILWVGTSFVLGGQLTAGELLSFYALIGYLTGPIISLISSNKGMQDAMIAADRLFEIFDLEQEGEHQKEQLTANQIGDIIFDRVSFKYGTRATIFDKLSFAIPNGKVTAFVGESGSGKSTISSLLQNLYPISNGTITIGPNDIRNYNNEVLRALVSVVPQQIDLFAGSIIHNIAIGDFNPDLDRVISICTQLGINESIEAMPERYQTILGEHGANLSGGQKQRIAIARAFYRNPSVLILDEATSSLDPMAEKYVMDAIIEFMKKGKTVIIIAHRLSTIINADKIIVLKNGAVTEFGSHHELLENRSEYYKLWAYNQGVLYN